jgi:hypothetical protein
MIVAARTPVIFAPRQKKPGFSTKRGPRVRVIHPQGDCVVAQRIRYEDCAAGGMPTRIR